MSAHYVLANTIDVFFDDRNYTYEDNLIENTDGSDYRKIDISFSRENNETKRIIISVNSSLICDIMVFYSDIGDCPAEKVGEVCRVIADINNHNRFFQWKYDSNSGIITSEYSYVIPEDALNRPHLLMSEFETYYDLTSHSTVEDEISRIKNVLGKSSDSNTIGNNSIKFNL